MKFHDRPYHQRFQQMGDQAETIYDTVKPLGKTTRFGWRRPKGIKFSLMPSLLRHMPDYYAEAGYCVEVMGLGKDGILKSLKTTKYDVLKLWSKFLKLGEIEIKLFVWNSHTLEWAIINWPTVVKLVAKSKRELGVQSFQNDGNEYYPIKWEWILEHAEFTANYTD